MTDRLLNLVSAIEENLDVYGTDISTLSYTSDYDYLLTIEQFYELDSYSTNAFDLGFLPEHRGEFEDVDVRTGVNEDGIPLKSFGDDVGRHWIELRVKE